MDLRKGTGLRYKMEESARLSAIKLELSADEWIRETDVVCIYSGRLFISKNDVPLSFVDEAKSIICGEISQSCNGRCHMIYPVCGI